MDIPRLSSKEAEVLRLLITNGEMYGLQLVNASDSLKRGTIYVTLGRMADKGYVESREEAEPNSSGGPRRLYRTTGLGMRAFRAWTAAGAAWKASWNPA